MVTTPARVLTVHASGMREGDPYLLNYHFMSAMMNFQNQRVCSGCGTLSSLSSDQKEELRSALYALWGEIALAAE